MAAWTANAAVGAAVLLAGISLLLAIVGFVSYLRVGHGRLFWVALAFVGLLAQGVYLAWTSYSMRAELDAGAEPTALWAAVSSLAVVLCLYLAVLKR